MRWKWLVLLTVVGIGCYMNLIYYRPVTALPANVELIAKMNKADRVQVQAVVNRIQLDERHYAVPVISKTQQRAISFWEWQRGEWQLVYMTTQKLLYMQLDEQDASTNYIVWHLEKQQEIEADFYLIRHRYFSVSRDNKQQYYPRVQLKQRLTFNETGAQPFAAEWITVMAQAKMYNRPSFSLFSDYVTEDFIIGTTSDDVFSSGFNSTNTMKNTDSKVLFFTYVDDNSLE